MDRQEICPDDYRDESPAETIAATKATIEHIHSIDPEGDIVKPIITPRFAPSCTPRALEDLGNLAAVHDPPLHIQTHISENKDEVSLVKDLFPSSTNYADVYDKANLLTPRTILAHGIYLSQAERELIQARQAKISHCPASNSSLGSGICPVRLLLDSGITVGLGTDVSGGYSHSILEAVRHACLVSRLLRHTTLEKENPSTPAGGETLSVEEGLYLATRGGAAVVDMADEIGGFDIGMSWDAQLIELGAVNRDTSGKLAGCTGVLSNVDIFDWEDQTEKVHKWVWNGDDRNVRKVWARGRLVHARDVDVETAIGTGTHTDISAKRGWGQYLGLR